MEPTDYRFEFVDYCTVDGLKTIRLGVTYEAAQAGLRTIATEINEPLHGFGNIDIMALQAMTHLAADGLRLAGDRQFSEPFLRPETPLLTLEEVAQNHQFKILVGNRFCHLVGDGASKGRAVEMIKAAWGKAHSDASTEVVTLGLGDSPNDILMLDAVDIAIVIPGINGPHPELASRSGYRIAPAPGCHGWAAAVADVAQEIGIPLPTLR